MGRRRARAVQLAAIGAMVLGPASASAAATALPDFADGGVVRVQDRLELRSYQPYSGLLFEGDVPRYVAPQRGLAPGRPEVVTPSRKPQIIQRGTPDPYTAQWYAYCAAKYLSFEPGTGLYTTYSGQKRTCR